MKYFSATIAAVTAIQVSSKSLAKHAVEVAQPDDDCIDGTISIDGVDLDWELSWGLDLGDEDYDSDYSDEEPSGPTMMTVEAKGNAWQIATVDTCAPTGFELCKVADPEDGLYIPDYALAKANEGTIIPMTETWGWYGVYGGFCEGRGYSGSCRDLRHSNNKDPMQRLTSNAVCVRC